MVRAFIEGLNFVLEAFIAVISPAMEIAGAFILKTWPFAGDFTGGGPNMYILSFVLGARGCLSICNLNAMVETSIGLEVHTATPLE